MEISGARVVKKLWEACGDFLVLLVINIGVYLRHPMWMARTAYRQRTIPNIAVPTHFREKRIWRLIFDQNPLFHLFGDKMATKEWMQQRAPGLDAARTLWSITSISELPADALRAGIVVKANSGCNQNLFLATDPEDPASIKALMSEWLLAPYTEKHGGRYWPNPTQKVFGEEVIISENGPLIDVNFFCCDGRVHFAVVTIGEKTDDERIAYFTAEGQRITSIMHEPGYQRDWLPLDFAVPVGYAEAARAAADLSVGIDFIRVDIMIANNRPYACEMSPFPGYGYYDTTALYKNWIKYWDIRLTWFVQQPKNGFMERYRKALGRRLGGQEHHGKPEARAFLQAQY